jgi:hypothetical protein
MEYHHMAAKNKNRYSRQVYAEIAGNGSRTTFGQTYTLIRNTDGTSNPKWRETISNGGDATGDLNANFDTLLSSPGSMSCTFYNVAQPNADKSVGTASWSGYRAGFEVGFPTAFDGSLVSTSTTRALINFNKKLREHQQAMSGGVFLGELREAAQMLRRPAQSLFNGIDGYLASLSRAKKAFKAKRGRARVRDVSRAKGQVADFESTAKLSKIAAESWLEYSFGWTPFIHDIEDAFNALDHLRDEVRYVKISAGGQADSSSSVTLDNPTVLGMMRHDRRVQTRYKCHVRIKGAIKIEPQMTYADQLKNWGVHTQDFVPTLWELIPWSFLVDYFTNIGDILNADNKLNSKLVWSCIGTKQSATRECQWAPNHSLTKAIIPTKYISSSGSTSFATFDRSKITRRKYTPSDLTLADIEVSLPTSSGQWLNMAALLRSANSVHAQRFNRLF